MAATLAKTGYGTVFSHMTAAGPPKVYTPLAEIQSVTPPNPEREMVDATHLTSDNGYREHIPALRDGGEVEITANYTKAGYQKMSQLFDLDVVAEFQITYPDASKHVFTGFVTGFGIDGVEVDDKISANATIKVTGKPVFTAGA